MIIRKYVVSDMREALVRAKYELGKEAVIISQKKIKEGKWFNPIKKKKIEVTIAIEEDMSNKRKSFNDANVITNEGNLNNKFRQSHSNIKSYELFFPDVVKKKFDDYCTKNNIITKKFENNLIQQFIMDVYKDNSFDKSVDFNKKVNSFIGPTGVGKTTTIAKIASREYLINKKKVGLITMDTYRIGAVEQLKTYANILGIPCETVIKPEDMKRKIEKLSYCDKILIDTAGSSHKNIDRLEEVTNYFKDNEINKYLVLSISTDNNTTESIMRNYKNLNYDSIILTKLDEVHTLSNFWNILDSNKVPIQYYCYGQNVPEEIEMASSIKVFQYLWGEIVNE